MSLQLPRFQNKKNSLELEREHFEKGQATSLQKAINTQETAVKEKHVRSAIIGTYQERGASTFWDCIHRLPTKEHPVLCWKFCFVLHKVLREGHENVVRDSQRYKPMLRELGKFWGHLRAGFGALIKCYCSLLEIKLTFHQRNSRIPGNLDIEYSDLVQSVGDSEDAFFQLSVEMLDYLDAILELQAEIFKTMDGARCNSMTHAGQCRLTPLIPCIQDSMLLYDYTTRILFHLHARLPADLLEGHRQRFLKVFHGLSQLYEKTMSLQYFKNLIAIQPLPKNPPNFLIQSDIENYETRKVTVLEDNVSLATEPEEEIIKLADINNGPDSPDPAAMAFMQMDKDKDRRIAELEAEVQKLKEYIAYLREESRRQIRELQMEIKKLTEQLVERNAEVAVKAKKIEEFQAHECKIPNDVAEQLDTAEKKCVAFEEKFNKVKNMYMKTREEHVDLIRKKAAVDKEVVELKKVVDGQSEMGSLVESLRREKEEVESNLFKKLSKKDAQVEELDGQIADLKARIESVESAKKRIESELQSELEKAKRDAEQLSEGSIALEHSNQSLNEQLQKLNYRCEELSKQLSSSQSDKNGLEGEIRKLQQQMGDNQTELENQALQRYNELLNACVHQCEGIMKKTIDDLDHPLLSGGTGAMDNFVINCRGSPKIVELLEAATSHGYSTFTLLKEIVERAPFFTHYMSNLLLHGSATSQTSTDIQKGDEMLGDCRAVGASILTLLGSIRKRATGTQLDECYDGVKESLKKLLATASTLGNCLTPEADAADALDKELQAMELAIEEASQKMEEMLRNTRASQTGVKLEVNEKLIDSCTTLMNAIRLLVQRSKGLQKEIVAQGKGTASVKEFYKRNHQWTEGLISAAKAVGVGAKFLLESADKAVSNPSAGFEFLIASSQEIAASTIQLVVASQVRADRSSQNLSLLKQASTGVKTATAGVVATAKDCSQLIEDSDEVDLAKLTTHNAKRLELETQAEVLRLQTELEKSRMRLAALRQHHYHNSD